VSPNLKAFLDMTAHSELGAQLLALSDDGYNVIVGSTPAKPILFHDYSRHPQLRQSMVIKGKVVHSDAAGRYQFMGRYWAHYKLQLSLPDFGPASQDRWAVQLIKECKALDDIETGHFVRAVAKCASRWASFPGAGYGQNEHRMDTLEAAYEKAGGMFA
jgi:muramidase (phage lysozyme)